MSNPSKASDRKISWIEKLASSKGILPAQAEPSATNLKPIEGKELSSYPPFEKWDNWQELNAKRQNKNYALVPTTCFNCEAGCGLVAYIDKEKEEVVKIEGNPYHVGSRGRNCAKGPATLSQLNDPERIMEPLKRTGERGSGQFEAVSWDEALDDIAGRIRKAMDEGRGKEVMYHVGRPGHEAFMERLLMSWGLDGHNSHTNICSSSARLGYQMSMGFDRPSPDYANAQLILLVSAHLESGHYFNPHAQRIMEAKERGARIVVMDPRLSNTASHADIWMPVHPGTETIVILAALKIVMERDEVSHEFIKDWVDWRGFLKARYPKDEVKYEKFIPRLIECYEDYSVERAAKEAGIEEAQIHELAVEIARAGNRVSTHVWRAAATGNEWGWQCSRVLSLLMALTGSVGTPGGTGMHGWNKYKPKFWITPEHPKEWNELQWPREYPLSHYEMSILLPHFLREERAKLDVYFARVYNPVWTNPDGFAWIEALKNEKQIGCFVSLTPTWNESSFFADYVLPMGLAAERHDIQSMETHNGIWVTFRQPVMRAYKSRQGEKIENTTQTNPGNVWEEDEFWIDLTWRIDPDGSRGIRKYYESPFRPGKKVTVEEYYRWVFENAVPGLPEAAKKKGMTPFEYMQRIGCFEVENGVYRKYSHKVDTEGKKVEVNEDKQALVDGKQVGVEVKGEVCEGFHTPSGRIEVHSDTLHNWGFADKSIPAYNASHVGPQAIDPKNGVYTLLPTFRLPTLIHTRSANAKYLNEISHTNPVWIHPEDAARHALKDQELVRVETAIGYFVNRVRITEAIRPGVLACSHHLGRWKLKGSIGAGWTTPEVEIEELSTHKRRLRISRPAQPFASSDKDTSRVWWEENGVNQNLSFPVQPDPASGMHCWHQVVKLYKATSDDRYGDVMVDLEKSKAHFEEWIGKSKKAPGPGGLRRPLWLPRPLKPQESAYKI